MSRVATWLNQLVQDPDGSPSSTRIGALLCIVAAVVLAVYGRIVGNQQAETITALLGGGAGAFFARTRSTSGA